jgi:mannose-6-phosphate isomerase
VELLGQEVCERFGNELPFLLKVLAAAEPLSIQAHPDRAQARDGWARENDEEIPVDASRRNYRDPNHKPELVCALTPFVALKGFRAPDDIARRLAPVSGPELHAEVGRLGREGSPAALRGLFTRLMTLEPEEKEAVLLRALAEAAGRGSVEPAWAWVERLHARYPEDVGTLSPLYLSLVVLDPGEALFLGPGELHAYLHGTALEIMANSDNVLRGGLTPKNVDVPELLRILRFEPAPLEILKAHPAGPGEQSYRTPAREFELSLVETTAAQPFTPEPGRGVEILLGIEGTALLVADGRELPLSRGRTLFVPATTASYKIQGVGRVARARVPA